MKTKTARIIQTHLINKNKRYCYKANLIERYVRGRGGGPYVSLTLRRFELEDIYKTPAKLNEYAAILSKGTHTKIIAKKLHLYNHPMFRRAIAEKQGNEQLMSILATIMYSLDPESQFADVSKVRKRRLAHARKEDRIRKKLKPTPPKVAMLFSHIYVYIYICRSIYVHIIIHIHINRCISI